jgi:membrane-bound metal-dependent hydrolase YbcI (DUF457 family)
MDRAEKAASLAQGVVIGVIAALLLHIVIDVVASRKMPLTPTDVYNPFYQSINTLLQAGWVHG